MALMLPFIYFIICSIIGISLHEKMLSILENEGEKKKYFLYADPRYFRDFLKLIKLQSDKRIKNKYSIILFSEIILIPTYIIGMFIVIQKFVI